MNEFIKQKFYISTNKLITFQGVVNYNVIGFQPGTEYFRLDPVSGIMTLKKSLYDNTDPNPSYTVSFLQCNYLIIRY
jgi:hypothetical protein